MINKLSDLYADRDFQTMTYSEQQQVKRMFFDRKVATDSEFKSFTPDEQEQVFYSIMDTAPAFEDLGGISITPEERVRFVNKQEDPNDPMNVYKKSIWLHDRAVMGDKTAFDEINGLVIGQTAMNQSLIAQAAMGIGDMLDGEDGPSPMAQDKAKVDKIADYLKASLSKDNSDRIGVSQFATTLGVGLAEGLAMNVFLVGSAGSKTALLTKGVYEGIEKMAAATAPGVAKNMLKTIVPEAAEWTMQGLAEVARSLPTMLNDGSIQGNKAVLENMVLNFGEGVVFDMGLYVAGKAFTRVAKPMVNMWHKTKLQNMEDINKLGSMEELLQPENFHKLLNSLNGTAPDKAILDQFGINSEEITDNVLKSLTNLTSKNVGNINTKEGFTAYAMLLQHDVDFKDGKILISQFDQPKFEATTLREANSYLSNYSKNLTFAKWSQDVVSASRAAYPEVNIKLAGRTQVKTDALPTERLMESLKPNMYGKIEPKNVRVVAEQTLKRAGVTDAKVEIEIVADMKTLERRVEKYAGNKIFVPKALTTQEDSIKYANYLHSRVTKFGELYSADMTKMPTMKVFRQGMIDSKNLTPENLTNVVKGLQGKLSIDGSNYHLELPGNAPQIFHNITEASKFVTDYRIKTLGINEDDLREHLFRSGRKLEAPKATLGNIDQYTVRGVLGHDVEATGATLEELISNHPEYMPKLPEYLTPQMSFIGEGPNQTVAFLGDMASGAERNMRQMLDVYDAQGAKAMRHLEHVVSKDKFGELQAEMMQTMNNRIVMEVPELGFRKTFASVEKAKQFMDNDLKQFRNIERIANERNIAVKVGNRGELIAVRPDGSMTIVNDMDGLRKFIADSPDSSGAKEWISFGDKMFDDEFNAQLQEIVAKDLDVPDPKRRKLDPEFHRLYQVAESFIIPMNDTLEGIVKTAGKTSFSEAQIKQIVSESNGKIKPEQLQGVSLSKIRIALNTAASLEASQGRKAEIAMNLFARIKGKQLDANTSRIAMILLEQSEANWAKSAKSLNFDLTPDHVRLLKNTKTFLDHYSTLFGVDSTKMLTNYAPKLRDALKELINNPAKHAQYIKMTKQQIINEVFGADPAALKTVNFFAKHTRIESFLTEGNDTNLIRSLKFYVDQGLHEKYSAPIIETAKTWMKNIDKLEGISPEQTEMISGWFKTISGEGLKGNDLLIDSMSTGITKQIARFMYHQSKKSTNALGDMSKVGSFYEALGDEFASRGSLDILNEQVTYATLGMRPLRGLYNMMQFNNTIGIFGRHANEAMDEIMEGGVFNMAKMEKHLQHYMERGLLTNKLFSSGHNNPHVQEGIKELSMRNQQNSEYWTRVATLLTIEKNFKETLPFYVNGKLTKEQFKKHSNIDFLDDEIQNQIMDFMGQGKPESALHLYQQEGVRILMGDYDASNYPRAFKGALGKLYGRFGVYPMNQIAFYKRIATRGSGAEKLARIARFGIVTTATYEAFKMMGVNYTGFLATDPWSFTGGPLFGVAQNMLLAKDTGPQGALARRELSQSWQLVVPFSGQARKMMQAYESANEGLIQKSIVEMMSGTYSPDSLLTPMFQ